MQKLIATCALGLALAASVASAYAQTAPTCCTGQAPCCTKGGHCCPGNGMHAPAK